MPLDQSNQYIADRRAWKEERQRLEAENERLRKENRRLSGCYQDIFLVIAEIAEGMGISGSSPYLCRETVKATKKLIEERARLREALKIIATHNAERGTALETVVIFAAMTLANEQRAFESGIDAGKRLAECGELPY